MAALIRAWIKDGSGPMWEITREVTSGGTEPTGTPWPNVEFRPAPKPASRKK